jgi:hypothetical protein
VKYRKTIEEVEVPWIKKNSVGPHPGWNSVRFTDEESAWFMVSGALIFRKFVAKFLPWLDAHWDPCAPLSVAIVIGLGHLALLTNCFDEASGLFARAEYCTEGHKELNKLWLRSKLGRVECCLSYENHFAAELQFKEFTTACRALWTEEPILHRSEFWKERA